MEVISKTVPCRENELETILDLMGDGEEPLPVSIFLSGCTSTGKTLCVDSVLHHLGYNHVFVNCIECYTPRILYETVLKGLGCAAAGEAGFRCDSLRDLLAALAALAPAGRARAPRVVVLDKCERLRAMDQNIISAFLRLRELTSLNICTILVTHLVYESFNFKLGVREPIKVYFSNYNKEELFKIIFLNQSDFFKHITYNTNIDVDIREELEKPELFANFLNSFLSVFYRPCRDLMELQHMAQVNFAKYCEPIIKRDIQAHDLQKLWRYISPILKASLELLYLRISSETKHPDSPGKENHEWEAQTISNLENTLKDELTSTKTFAQSFELPYYAKFLLIAAYLASYNPPKEDKRLFMKHHGKQRKRLQQVRAKAKITEKLNTQLGPKMFTLDRLLAIFYAILEEKIGLTSNLLAQIATLVELKLIAGSKELDLDSAKYKCIVGYDFISAIGQTVSFNVRKYLYDFM